MIPRSIVTAPFVIAVTRVYSCSAARELARAASRMVRTAGFVAASSGR
jgi:hypothetical protein